MMIGGRISAPTRRSTSSSASTIALWRRSVVRPGFFLDFVSVPAGALAGEGRYARLTVSAQGPGEGGAPPVAIEQFNLQAPDRVQFGFDEGWYEPEYNPQTAQSWRWMSERAVIKVQHAGSGSLTLRVRGESPLRYFSTPPRLSVRVGDRVLAEVAPTRRFPDGGRDPERRPGRRRRPRRPDLGPCLRRRREGRHRRSGGAWPSGSIS